MFFIFFECSSAFESQPCADEDVDVEKDTEVESVAMLPEVGCTLSAGVCVRLLPPFRAALAG